MRTLSDLTPNPKNPRRMTDRQREMLKKSLAEFGDLSGFIWNKQTGRLVGGHQRRTVLPEDANVVIEKKYSKPTRTGTIATGFVDIDGERFAYREVEWGPEREKAANIAANQHGGEFDTVLLAEDILSLDAINLDMDLLGFAEDQLANLMAPTGLPGGGSTEEDPATQTLAEKFLIPPFTVLNAREGWWQERKRQWIELGIQSELGRGDTPLTDGGGDMAAAQDEPLHGTSEQTDRRKQASKQASKGKR